MAIQEIFDFTSVIEIRSEPSAFGVRGIRLGFEDVMDSLVGIVDTSTQIHHEGRAVIFVIELHDVAHEDVTAQEGLSASHKLHIVIISTGVETVLVIQELEQVREDGQ